MDGCKGLQNRDPDVWEENLLERDVEVATIQRLRQQSTGDRQQAVGYYMSVIILLPVARCLTPFLY